MKTQINYVSQNERSILVNAKPWGSAKWIGERWVIYDKTGISVAEAKKGTLIPVMEYYINF